MIFKQILNLVKCKIDKYQAWQWANTRKGHWRTSKSPILCRALDKDMLQLAGYPFLSDYYSILLSDKTRNVIEIAPETL